MCLSAFVGVSRRIWSRLAQSDVNRCVLPEQLRRRSDPVMRRYFGRNQKRIKSTLLYSTSSIQVLYAILTYLLTYPLHAVWHIRLAQDLARPLCLGLSLLLCSMSTQQPSVLLPLFVATLFSACLFFCFLLASRLALFLLAGRCSSCKYDQAMSTFSFFRMRQMCRCFVAWWSLVLEMVLGQYIFSIFLKHM